MKIYKTTFDYNDSANILKQLTVPTDTTFSIGVKVIKDGTSLDGTITLNDGSTTLSATSEKQGYQVFELPAIDDEHADPKYTVKFSQVGKIAEGEEISSAGSSRLKTINVVASTDDLIAAAVDVTPEQFYGFIHSTSHSWTPYNWFGKYPGGTYDGVYKVKTTGVGYTNSQAMGIGNNGYKGIAFADYGLTRVDGEWYWYVPDDEMYEQEIPADKLLKTINTSTLTPGGFFLVWRFSQGENDIIYKWYCGNLNPMSASWEGIQVNCVEEPVVEVNDKVTEVYTSEGEKIEVDDLATKSDIPVPTASPIKLVNVENTSSGEYTVMVDGNSEDYTLHYNDGQFSVEGKSMFRIIHYETEEFISNIKFSDKTYALNNQFMMGDVTCYDAIIMDDPIMEAPLLLIDGNKLQLTEQS